MSAKPASPPVNSNLLKTVTGSRATDQALAGFTGGAISTLVLHPFDLVKTRLQVSTAKLKLSSILSQLSQQGASGFYRGIGPNLAGSTLSWGLYFFWYSHIKDALRLKGQLKWSDHLLASASAGMLTTAVTNPIFVVKTRMFVQTQAKYNGLLGEGIKGLYRGIVPALFGVSHGALQFMAYEELKVLKKSSSYKYISTDSTLNTIGIASLSKVFATIVTYPYQVVKSRMQNDYQAEHRSVYCSCSTIAKEGVFGFYKGMAVNIVRVLPGTCITFAVYEAMSSYLRSE